MLNERIKQRINEVETKSEYDDLMNSFALSDAPIELKKEAMDELKKVHHILMIKNILHQKKFCK